MAQNRVPLQVFRTILFATDFARSTRQAFEIACSLARAESCRLVVLHVDEPDPVNTQIVGMGDLPVAVYIPDEDLSGLEPLDRQLRKWFVPSSALTVEYHVRRGRAAEVILAMAKEKSCDLIIMGTQGRTGLDRWLLGSVAEYVMRHADCPCLTVRQPIDKENEHAVTIRTILHPTDFSHHAENALWVARALARDHGARLLLMHVVPVERLSGVVQEALMETETARDSLEKLRSSIDRNDLKYSVETCWRRGDVVEQIRDVADERKADLIVMGSHGRTGLARVLFGSVTEGTMRNAICPVLAVKSPMSAVSTKAPFAETLNV